MVPRTTCPRCRTRYTPGDRHGCTARPGIMKSPAVIGQPAQSHARQLSLAFPDDAAPHRPCWHHGCAVTATWRCIPADASYKGPAVHLCRQHALEYQRRALAAGYLPALYPLV